MKLAKINSGPMFFRQSCGYAHDMFDCNIEMTKYQNLILGLLTQ